MDLPDHTPAEAGNGDARTPRRAVWPPVGAGPSRPEGELTWSGDEPDAADFAVLFVCTANHCRSPLAEHLLRAQLILRGLSWTVSSAGVSAQPGQPMHPSAARLLDRQRIRTDGWTSHRLDAPAVAAADLVLTATETHRGAVARLIPSAMPRTFTLLQFAHLVQALPHGGPIGEDEDFGPELLARAVSTRGRVQPMTGHRRDLADPMGQPFAKFRKCAALIERSLDQILQDRPLLSWNTAPRAGESPRRAADPDPDL